MINRSGLGIACALGAACLYGLVPNFARGALVNGVPTIETIFFRTSLIGVAFLIAAVVRGESLAVPRGAMASFAGQATATLIVSVGYLSSVQFIPVGLAAIIFFTFPVLIVISAPLVEGHAPGLVRTGITILAFAGLAVAIGPSFESLDVRGLALAAAAAALCVLQFYSGRAISVHMTPTAFGGLVHLAIWPFILAISLWVGGGAIRIFPGGSASGAGLLFMAGVGALYVGGYLGQMLSLRFAPASTVAPFFNLEPVVATATAALLLGERLALNQYAGGVLVLAALIASSFVGRVVARTDT
jgi:drug/metabolite transporter (DMT)-like permease